MFDKVEIKEKHYMSLEGYTLVEGFPGMGLVGTIAISYLIDKLGFEEYGHVDCEFFQPIVRIKEGFPKHPAQIYINKELKIVALASEQIIPRMFAKKLAKAVVEWVRRRKIGRIISIEGIHTHGNDEKVYGIACSKKAREELEKFDVTVVNEGITSGVTSMILLELLNDPYIVAYSLLGNVTALEDYRAAAFCLNKLAEILGLKIDTRPLLEEAKNFEEKLKKQLAQLKQVHENVKQFEESAHPLMYT